MTDTNIIHALQCCGVETNCRNCPLYEERSADCIYTVLKNALDLITRQQAENENLKVENQSLRSAANSLKMHYEEAQAEVENYKHLDVILHTAIDITANIKSEAVKAFAERLKEKSEIVHLFSVHTGDRYMVDIDDIDNLVKEMVGENND